MLLLCNLTSMKACLSMWVSAPTVLILTRTLTEYTNYITRQIFMSHSNIKPDTAAHQKLQACIDACGQCHESCLHTAMTHCLETGGDHVEAGHFSLMMSCAEICQTTSNFMLSGSSFHKDVAAVCATICEACAESCDQIAGLQECAKTCRECADSCRKMATAEH